MSDDCASYLAQVIRFYLDDPDTPTVPTSADWDIARDLWARGVPLQTVHLAFQLAFVRRQMRGSADPLPPIRSLAYFRAVLLNLTPEERESAYCRYIHDLCQRLRNQISAQPPPTSNQNRAKQPKSGGFS